MSFLLVLSNCFEELYSALSQNLSQEMQNVLVVPHGYMQHQLHKRLSKNDLTIQLFAEFMQYAPPLQPQRIHLFAHAFLQAKEWERLLCLASESHLIVYMLSPCRMFWTDMRSDSERQRLLRMLEKQNVSLHSRTDLDTYLRDRHRLLANLGKAGRESFVFLEEAGGEIDERYLLPQAVLTHSAYADCFTEGIAETSVSLTLFEALKADMLLLRAREQKLTFDRDDSLGVCAANSKLDEVEEIYRWLQTQRIDPADTFVVAPVMEAYAPYIKMLFAEHAYQLETTFLQSSRYAQGFWQFVTLPIDNWKVTDVLTLLSQPALQKKWQFSEEGLALFSRWLERGGFHNWQKQNALPVSSEREEVNAYLAYLSLVRRDLAAFKAHSSWTASQMGARSLELLEAHFSAEGAEESERQTLKNVLQRMCGEKSLSFEEALKALKEALSFSIVLENRWEGNGMRFLSLESGMPASAKVVVVMGMDEDSFPRLDEGQYLESTERYRYLFLEALLAARERLLITYTAISPEDKRERSYSSVVSELMAILDDSFILSNNQKVSEACLTRSSKPERIKNSLCPSGFSEPLKNTTTLFKIADLSLIAKSASAFYLERILGIDPYLSLQKLFGQEPFLQTLKPSSLRVQKSLLGLAEEQPEQEEWSPLVRAMRAEETQTLLEGWRKGLHALNVSLDELFSIELRADCLKPQQVEEGLWITPALVIDGKKIEGRLRDLSPEGLVIWRSAADWEGFVRAWPLFLLLHYLPQELQALFKKRCLFLKTVEAVDLYVQDSAKALQAYLRYCEKVSESLLPITAQWTYELYQGDEKALQRKLDAAAYFQRNRAYELPKLAAAELIEQFSGLVALGFSELFVCNQTANLVPCGTPVGECGKFEDNPKILRGSSSMGEMSKIEKITQPT